MGLSVHTNKSAMIALQALNRTNAELEEVQTHLNTGLKIAGAKDNAAVFAVAQNMRSDLGAYSAVQTSLNRAASVAEVGLAAGEAISDLLVQMREKATAAIDPSIDTFTRSAYNADFRALIDQLNVVISNAAFDGANILTTSLGAGIEFLSDANGTQTITLKTQDLTISGPNVVLDSTASLGTATLAAGVVSALKTSLDNVNQALANIGSDLKKITAHNTFIDKLRDTLTSGVGNLVDADLAVEAALLQALQVKQQLGIQTLSIANSQPGIILSLFQ